MSKMVIDLTLPVIKEEIDNVLEMNSYRPYQAIFSMPDFCQELITYALNHVRSRYRMIDEDQPSRGFRALPIALEERLQIEAVVQQGIRQILSQFTT